GMGGALLAFNVEGARARVDNADMPAYTEQLAAMLLRGNEQVDATRVSMDFSTQDRKTRDYNDPNYILERLNSQAKKAELKELSDLEKVYTQIKRDQVKEGQKLA